MSTGLIPSRIPYGTLYDRTYQWSGLNEWKNSDTTTATHLFQSWQDAEQSVIDPLVRPRNYDTMRSVVQQQLFATKLPVIALNFQFAYFDSTCVQDGRVSVTNGGMLIDNQLASPYFTKQVTIAGVAADSIFLNTNYSLQYGSPLLLNNASATIQYIVVNNLTAGTQYTLTAGVAQSIQFTQPGNNVMRFTVTLSDATSYVTHQVIKVKDINGTQYLQRPQSPIGPHCAATNDLLQSDIPFQGYTETQATNSFADYHIYYHTQSPTGTDCERVLRKPIIVLDGFDPKNTRQYYDIYKNYLINNDNGVFVGNDLRDKGYDIIILNFPVLGEPIYDETGVSSIQIPTNVKINGTSQTVNASGRDGGADYIERNAFLLVKLIQQVNATLAANGSNEKIVVVGPSMGGQISRYALAYMEKQQALGVPGMNHNCRLWVSFDSPHDGANIPMAVQETLRFFGTEGRQAPAADAYQNQLRTPAARQMLIEQLDGQNSTASFNQTYYNNLRSNGLAGSNGYPMNLRKVTLLNGTGNFMQTYGDGAEVLNGEGRKTFLNIKVFELIENFLPSYGQNKRIVKERITIPKFLNITFITKSYSVTNINNRGSMDAVQGSITSTINDIYTQFSEALKKQKGVRQTWFTNLPNHCFIPSISALGFKNSNFDWNTKVNNRNLLCNNEIYFDNYYIPAVNQPHIYLNTDNINWLTEEFDKGQPNCPVICSFAITGGADQLCANMITTYNLDVIVPSGASTQWVVSPNLQIISSTNNSVTIKELTSNTATISANITNPCGANVMVTRQITAGSPSIPDIYAKRLGGTCYFDAAVDMPTQGITVEFSEDGSNWSAGTKSGNTFLAGYDELLGPRYKLVYARTRNSCGTGEVYSRNISIPPPPRPCAYSPVSKTNPKANTLKDSGNMISKGQTDVLNEKITNVDKINVYPNPANKKLIIELPVLSNNAWVNIYGNEGKLMLSQRLGNTTNPLDISNFRAGVYWVRITDGENTSTRKIIKK